MDPLEKKSLGRTGLEVTRLGLGCASIGGLFGDIPEEQAIAVVHRALALGINLYDTAPLYGAGRSEARLGRALGSVPRDCYVLCTKVGRVLDPAPDAVAPPGQPPPLRPVFDFSRDGILRSFEESLQRLGVDRIDVLHIHDPDQHYEEAIAQAYPTLARLRREGAVRGISAGMNQWQMLARFAREGEFDCFLLAGRYSLLEQGALEELFPLCLEKGIGILAGGTYNTGILAQGAGEEARYNYRQAPPEIVARARRIEAVAARWHVDVKAAASQFVLAHPAVTAIIPGTRRPERVEENFRAVAAPIPAGFWDELRAEGLVHPEAPVPGEAG
ncbi:MAG: aldo/keto reductase [Gemmatimonadota bacterium]